MSSRNRHAQELHEQTTMHTRFSHWKLLWAICNSLMRRYIPSSSSCRDKEERLLSKIISHVNIQSQSVMMLVGKSESVYIRFIII